MTICLVVMVPLCLFVAFREIEDNLQQAENNLERSQFQARVAAAHINSFIASSASRMQVVARRPTVMSLDPNNCDPNLTDFAKRNPEFNNLLTFDLEGNLICSAVPPGPNAPKRVDPSFFLNRVIETNDFVVGRATRGFVTGRWTAALALPIHDSQGMLIGVIDAALNLASLDKMISEVLLDDGHFATIIDSRDMVLTLTEGPDKYIGTDASRSEVVSHLRARGAGAVKAAGFDNVVRYWGAAPIKETDWIVLVGLPAEPLDNNMAEHWLKDIVVAILALIAMLAGVYAAGRRMVRPIEALHEVVKKAHDGDLSVRASLKGPREITEFAEVLNLAFDNIEHRIKIESVMTDLLRKLQQAVEQSTATIMITNSEGLIEYVNPQFERTSGYSAAEAMGKNPSFLSSGDKDSKDYSSLWHTIQSGQSWSGEFTNRRKSGELFHEQAIISPILNDSQEITHFVAVKEDITQRREAEKHLAESESRYRLLTENAPIGIVMHDGSRITYANHTMLNMLRAVAEDQLQDTSPLDIFQEEFRTSVRNRIERVLDGGPSERTEAVVERLDGTSFHAEVTEVSLYSADKGMVLMLIQDVDKRKQAEAKADRLLNYDPLTDLPNRNLLVDRIEQAIMHCVRMGKRVAVLTLGLDHFKFINESLGHSVGDRVLSNLALELNSVLRGSDTLARVGGDIFAIVLNDLSSHEDVTIVAKKLIERVAAPRTADGHEVHLTCSIGVALYPTDGEDATVLLMNADTALFQAKKEGRNQYYFFRHKLNDLARERSQMQVAIKRGLQHGEFFMVYQPQYDLATSRLTGLEALVRWKTDEGVISPARFIPVAEQTGQVMEIGRYVIENVIAQLAAWKRSGLNVVPVGINIAADQFADPEFEGHLAKCIKQNGIEGGLIDLEMTESSLMGGEDFLANKLLSIKASGVKISVDDFGTGYSSLLYLKRFPIDRIKIDQGFVRSLQDSKEDQALVRAIIAVARSLGMKTIAEGVERDVQRDFLRDEGCDEVQGYLFSQPLEVPMVEELLAR